MKHKLGVTFFLLLLFIFTQGVGLLIVNKYLGIDSLPFDIERPKYDENTSFIPITIAILIGSVLLFLLAKFKAVRIWKIWFFFSVLLTLLISFGAFMHQNLALFLALLFSILKVFRSNFVIHNITEIFIYAGLASIFVPILNILSVTILLLIISVYDMWAVWKSKHMIKLAKFQTDSKLFAGINIPYDNNKKTAIIGGGDIAFSLLFSGVILKTFSLADALVVSLFTSMALFVLLSYGKKNKFYPAMPFLTAGCLIGYAVILFF
jgi:presenilin-like A22 family membrane protease